MFLELKRRKDPILVFNFSNEEDFESSIGKFEKCNERFKNVFGRFDEITESVDEFYNKFDELLQLLKKRTDTKHTKEDVEMSSILYEDEFIYFLNAFIAETTLFIL